MTGTGTGGPGAGDPPPNTSQGWGRIHLENALYFQGDTRKLWLVDETTGLQTGEEHLHQVNVVGNGEPLHRGPRLARLPGGGERQSDPDQPAPARGHRSQQPDLDPEASRHRRSQQSRIPSRTRATVNYDDRNNVHRIRFASPQLGTYTIKVRGINVAMGGSPPRQPYALVATGDIAQGTTPDFFLSAVPNQATICAGDSPQFTINALGILGWSDAGDPLRERRAGPGDRELLGESGDPEQPGRHQPAHHRQHGEPRHGEPHGHRHGHEQRSQPSGDHQDDNHPARRGRRHRSPRRPGQPARCEHGRHAPASAELERLPHGDRLSGADRDRFRLQQPGRRTRW
ncbi:MAG: hypothetical protein RML12_05995 [Xanthomonadales bacterium]|nr:hypothetical protein [Xanthomonadales bacterium]